MQLSKISLENLGTPNKNMVRIGSLTLWFSYETIVAFEDGFNFKACENCFSKTTGKLLNDVCPNHKERLPFEEFKKQLQEVLNKHNLTNE